MTMETTRPERQVEGWSSNGGEAAFFSSLYRHVHEGYLEVRAIGPPVTSQWFPITYKGFCDAIQYAGNWPASDVYFGVNPRRFGGRDDASVVSAAALWVDLDGVGGEAECWHRLEECRAGALAPDAAVFSGRGLHLYWVLKRPLPSDDPDLPIYLRSLKAICEQYHGDPKCVNISRIMRFPGTINTKNGVRSKVWVDAYAH